MTALYKCSPLTNIRSKVLPSWVDHSVNGDFMCSSTSAQGVQNWRPPWPSYLTCFLPGGFHTSKYLYRLFHRSVFCHVGHRIRAVGNKRVAVNHVRLESLSSGKQGCQIGREIWSNLATLAVRLFCWTLLLGGGSRGP